jgi:hypothetical protein
MIEISKWILTKNINIIITDSIKSYIRSMLTQKNVLMEKFECYSEI